MQHYELGGFWAWGKGPSITKYPSPPAHTNMQPPLSETQANNPYLKGKGI